MSLVATAHNWAIYAMEFARRWLRESLESLREPGQTKDELHDRWSGFGEEAVVYSPGRSVPFQNLRFCWAKVSSDSA